MVGAKSVGCSTCKSRKVKCDERFPICANCERAKRHCSGPKARFIRFIAPGNEQHMRGDAIRIGLLHSPARSQSESLAALLAARLDGIEESGYQLQALGIFFPYLVPRVGHSPALDAAVKCLLGAHQNLISGIETSCNKDLLNYNHALSLIRKDLSHVKSRTTTETVCASLLLCRYEVLKDNSPAYITHAGGVGALIEAWGPDRINSEFELALFRSHYGSIIAACVFTGKECFLAAPEWDAVRIKALALSSYDPYASDILTAWASLPNLLIRLRDQPNDPHFCSIHEARLFKAKISKVAAGIPFDVEELTLDCESPASPTSCVPSYYSFPTLMVAARYTVYWAIVIIANSILLWEGEVNPSLVYECQFAADNICKSTEFFRRHKPLGHSAIGTKVVLSVAFGTSSVEQQEWIVQEMQDLFEAKSREFWRASLQFTSDVLTGARAGKMEKWVKL